MFTKQETGMIKKQLLENLKSFPEEQEEWIKSKVDSLSPEELEELLKQNNLFELKCVSCSIISGRIPSYKIAENSENIAVLEINPLSKGNVLIIPKKHPELLKSSEELTAEIIQKIKYHLKPKNIKLEQKEITEHNVIEIIPDYGEPLKRKKATKQELMELQQILIKPVQKLKEIQIADKKVKEEIPVLPPRIP